jgi:hypothetical protein
MDGFPDNVKMCHAVKCIRFGPKTKTAPAHRHADCELFNMTSTDQQKSQTKLQFALIQYVSQGQLTQNQADILRRMFEDCEDWCVRVCVL